jgi:predicted phosphohydrolase
MAKSAGHTEGIVLALHFPPTNEKLERSGFIELIERYGVKTVIYGHLHSTENIHIGLHGDKDRVTYALVSANNIGFSPLRF